ncbi:MAG TPA: hypothetical protein VGF44_03685 [Terriglobales bacterium]
MIVTRALKNPIFLLCARMFFLLLLALLVKAPAARAELHWEADQREQMRLRIVALATAYPRSSVFSTDEVFIAEMQISHDESRLVKLVYAFLPYQPRLSEYGLDYSLVHELTALRDPNCDESLHQLMTVQKSDGSVERNDLKYSTDSPVLDVKHERGILHCYRTTPEEYAKAIHDPVQHPQFSLKLRR